jgi:hypothetical protein
LAGIHLELSKGQVENIVGLLGYGNPAESVWFVGIEEGLGKANSGDAKKNLEARGSFNEIMDLRDAHHQKLREDGQLIDFDAKPPFTPVWQWIAKIMCASSGNDWREYVKSSLGRNHGDTFLTELSPIPSAKAADKAWIRAFQALDGELTEKLDRRRRTLLHLLEERRPRLIVCYGDGEAKAREFERFFGLKWTPIRARISTGSRRACPFLLLPFFGLGQMSQSVIEEMRDLGLLPARVPEAVPRSANSANSASSAF